ncbi:AAA family ATPase [Adhaeribacter radiodurans]|uniref:AAA family ATPase n=1 Tax=Adhaeribacter radiodurans TaxID=2745197 RepID=A0A7L7LC03_9BACT|nr:AAA family ATPase [Adhaeribacter radiodurans]QMU30366.1 AAA family ATPase [Adhaeribacter radiodurans]
MTAIQLKSITREHILQAINHIDRQQINLRASTVYDVVYKGKRYPPRELLRLAHQVASGTAAEWVTSAGITANSYLEKLGFSVVNKRPLFLLPPEDDKVVTEVAVPAEIALALSSPSPSLELVAEPKITYKANKVESYSLVQALEEIFLEEHQLQSLMAALRRKMNLILQGPPGTGKSFLAKRLAFLDQGRQDLDRIEIVQFHSNYAYDDFIQGYRPDTEGKFKLTNGVFYNFCQRAVTDPEQSYYFIIEEINRGNVSSIFGEMLFLLEADKRGPAFATSLTYGQSESEKFYIPENVFVIGTMNTADRALTLLDYALRRRFAFFRMEPQFNEQFHQYLLSKNVLPDLVIHISNSLTKLNQRIADDSNLGPGFRIGHSYFSNPPLGSGFKWFNGIIENEIAPLLEEYWFDNPKQVAVQLQKLRVG